MNRLFTDILTNIGNNIQDTSTAMQTILRNYANDTYFDILKRVNFQSIDEDYSFSTVAGQKNYPLPDNFGKEVFVRDATNLKELSPINLQQLIADYPSTISTQGEVERYTILDSPVRSQPSSASILSLVSSSASDTTQTVRVKGTNSAGVEIDESVTLNGTTTAVTTNSFVEVRSITKSASTTGYVTITSNSGAVTVALLSPAQMAYLIKIIRLHQIPAGVITVQIPYIIRPYPLVSNYDQPIIDCADVIELGATAKAWRYKRQFMKADEFEKLYEKSLAVLVWDKENSFNEVKLFNPKPYPRDSV